MDSKKTILLKIAKIIVFICILGFLLRSVSYIVRSNGDSRIRFAGFYAEEKNSIDVLMLGSSTVGTSFCAPYMWDKYGFTSYPLSSNSQRPKAMKYLIEEGMRYQAPSLIVIEMRTFIADDEEMAEDEAHIREIVDNMQYSWHRIETINAVAEQFDDKWSFYVDLFKYHSNIGMLIRPEQWKYYNYSTKSIEKGFVIKNHVEQFRIEDKPDLYTEERKPIPQNQEEVLRDLLVYLKDNNLEALFVATPRAGFDDYEAMMNYCEDIVEGEGYKFLNLNYKYDEMQFSYRTDIDDGAHTNVWGALKCSDYLGQYIRDNYDIKNSHSEKVRNDWDEAYAYFLEQYNATEREEK